MVPFSAINVPELGAPFGANWNDIPNFLRQHKLQLWLAGISCRVLGLFAASNLVLLLAHVLAAAAFYGVARYFRARPEWALAGALTFAFSHFFFYRSLDHINITFCWPVPLAILLVSWAFGSRGVSVGSRRFWAGAAIAVVAGLHSVYYAALLAQFLALAGFAQLLRARSRSLVLGPWILLCVLIVTVAADCANVLASNWGYTQALPSQVRPYGNLERYALKPIELILPAPGWGLTPWPSVAAAYANGALYRGELGAAYLGLVGLVAFLWMCVSAFRGYLRKRRGFLPAALVAITWVVAYSMVGGLNGLLGALGFSWFRGTNRYSIWILALVLLWSVGRLSRAPWTRRRGWSVLAAVLVTGVALRDQFPRGGPATQVAVVGRTLASDRTFTRSLEATLPPEAMLFMLPVVDFPEGARVRKATDYEHFRPYLFSTRLRYSYGSDKGRPREEWQRAVEELAPEAMAAALEELRLRRLDREPEGVRGRRRRATPSPRRERPARSLGEPRPRLPVRAPATAGRSADARGRRPLMVFLRALLIMAAVCVASLASGRILTGAVGIDVVRRLHPSAAAASTILGVAFSTLVYGWLSLLGLPAPRIALFLAGVHLVLLALCVYRGRLDVFRPRGPAFAWAGLLGVAATTAVVALLPVLRTGGFSIGNDTYTYCAFSEWLQTHGFGTPAEWDPASPVASIPWLWQQQKYPLGAAYFLALVQAVVRVPTALLAYPAVAATGMVLASAGALRSRALVTAAVGRLVGGGGRRVRGATPPDLLGAPQRLPAADLRARGAPSGDRRPRPERFRAPLERRYGRLHRPAHRLSPQRLPAAGRAPGSGGGRVGRGELPPGPARASGAALSRPGRDRAAPAGRSSRSPTSAACSGAFWDSRRPMPEGTSPSAPCSSSSS